MIFFIDTANVEEIKSAAEMGIISGVTTNPSLIAKEGRSFIETIKEITTIVDGPISAEVISLEANEMVREAKTIYDSIKNDNIVIKIPMCTEGLKAVKKLTAMGIKTNVTLIFSAGQAILVSPFIGRLDDIGFDGMNLITEIADIFRKQSIRTQIIAASTRSPLHVIQAAKAGSDVITVPYKVLMAMAKHPLTDSGIRKFLSDWESLNNPNS